MNKQFLINFISLNASSLFNKVLNFILFIFLIRYLTPAGYGVYNIVWAQVGLLAPFVDFGTTTYGLVHEESEKKQHFIDLISLRLFLAIIILFLTIALSFLFGYPPVIISYITLVSVVIIANMWSGSYLILSSIQQKNYYPALVSMGFNAIFISILIVFLVMGKTLSPVFATTCVAYIAYAVLNWYLIRRGIGKFTFNVHLHAWEGILKKSLVFVLISFFAGLYFKLDVIVLKFLKSESEVGIYSAGYKFFEAFMFIASTYNFTGVRQLLRAKNTSKHAFRVKMMRDLAFMGLIGLAVSIAMLILAPLVLPMVLKQNFSESIRVVQIVILALPFVFMSTVLLNALYLKGKAKTVVALFAFQVVFNLVSNYVLIPHFSFYASAYITVVGEIINTILTFYFVIHD